MQITFAIYIELAICAYHPCWRSLLTIPAFCSLHWQFTFVIWIRNLHLQFVFAICACNVCSQYVIAICGCNVCLQCVLAFFIACCTCNVCLQFVFAIYGCNLSFKLCLQHVLAIFACNLCWLSFVIYICNLHLQFTFSTCVCNLCLQCVLAIFNCNMFLQCVLAMCACIFYCILCLQCVLAMCTCNVCLQCVLEFCACNGYNFVKKILTCFLTIICISRNIELNIRFSDLNFVIVQWLLIQFNYIKTIHSCCPFAIILSINVVLQWWEQKLWEKDCRYLASNVPRTSLYTSSPWTHPLLPLDSDTERTKTRYTLSIFNVYFQNKCFRFTVWFGLELQLAVLWLRKSIVLQCKGSLCA